MNDLDRFYENLCDLTEDYVGDVSHIAKTVALFRVAIEYGATHMGVPTLGYMMSRLLTVTLGVGQGSNYTTYDSILDEFEPSSADTQTERDESTTTH